MRKTEKKNGEKATQILKDLRSCMKNTLREDVGLGRVILRQNKDEVY